MENDEKFLRVQVLLALNSHKIKYIRALSENAKVAIIDATVNQWRQGNMTGKQAIEWAIKHAKSNYKVTR